MKHLKATLKSILDAETECYGAMHRLLDHEITPEDDEVTATGKLKRSFVNEKYKDMIDEMYNEK